MRKQVIIFLTLLSYFVHLICGDYIAAVVEHSIFYGQSSDSPESKLNTNLEIYDGLISLSREKNVQVIVFPEFGLTPVDPQTRSDLYPYAEQIPEISSNASFLPCTDPSFGDKPILQKISCASQRTKQLVLVEMIDSVPCDIVSDTSCPSDGHYQYNTDALFDAGYLVAKYHKSHEWPGLKVAYDQPMQPSRVTYMSKFGVEFGLFICFDIMFEDPPKILRSSGIEHFLYAVKQGEIGEKTLIEGWSKNNAATVLSANLGSGKHGDCSGLIVNGTYLNINCLFIVYDSELPKEQEWC
jgi:predicted amidohydrolase